MRPRVLLTLAALCAVLYAQEPLAINMNDGAWEHAPKDPPGVESRLLREDKQTGGMELLARHPAGHQLHPHWHTVNERVIVQEGRLAVRAGELQTTLEPGGFAYFPAKQVHTLTCVSGTRCAFYVAWDGKLETHRAAEK